MIKGEEILQMAKDIRTFCEERTTNKPSPECCKGCPLKGYGGYYDCLIASGNPPSFWEFDGENGTLKNEEWRHE